jgi:two-component sensor histidine kinase
MARTRQPGRTRRRLARWLDPTAGGPVAAPTAPTPPQPGAPQPAEHRPGAVPRWPHVLEQISLRILAAVYQAGGQLESIEAEEHDPDRLQKLYRIDHAVTRVRRQAENMQVLAGRQVEDADRQVTSLLDVVRAAASAIEQYSRVHLGRIVDLAVVEFAADDVMRVLTELADNATKFSPPTSSVVVSAHLTEQGSVLIRVEDDGLGIRPEELPRWNAVLSGAAAVPTERTTQLGLTVVSRLAANHRLRVHLVPRQTGGTTATVLVPAGLLCEIPDADVPPAPLPPASRRLVPVDDVPVDEPPVYPDLPVREPGRTAAEFPDLDPGPAPAPAGPPTLPTRTPSSLRSDDTVVMPVVTDGPPPAADRTPWYEDVAAFAAGTAEAGQPTDHGQEG